MFKLGFYVPLTHLEQVKEAIFKTGAGTIGSYEKCCWQALGTGQFAPKAGSQPFLGEIGVLETVDEYRVELVCEGHQLSEALAALRSAHPYETPAFDVVALVDTTDL